MQMFLALFSGIAWMIVYEECIRLGFRDKIHAMPFWALGLNFAWETIYAVGDLGFHIHGPLEGITFAQAIVNAFWALLDVVILYTYFKFSKSEWNPHRNNRYFVLWSVMGIVVCYLVQLAFIWECGVVLAAQYSAFIQNLIMSISFIYMYLQRGSRGQSVLLAVAKWVGTLAPTLLFGCGVMFTNKICLVCGFLCSVFDIIYIVLIIRDKKHPLVPAEGLIQQRND